jgi:hypothetical protein
MKDISMNRVFALFAVFFVASHQLPAYSQTPRQIYLKPFKYTDPSPATNSINGLTLNFQTTATVPSTMILSNKTFKLYAYYQSTSGPVTTTTYTFTSTMTSVGNGDGMTTYTFSGTLKFTAPPLQPGIFLNFFDTVPNGETYRWPSNNFKVQ